MTEEAKSNQSSSEKRVASYASHVSRYSCLSIKSLVDEGQRDVDDVLNAVQDPAVVLPRLLARMAVMGHHLNTIQRIFYPQANFRLSKAELTDEMLHELIESELDRVVSYISKRNNPHKP